MLQSFVALPVLRLVLPHAAFPALEWRSQEAGPPAQVRGGSLNTKLRVFAGSKQMIQFSKDSIQIQKVLNPFSELVNVVVCFKYILYILSK